MTFVISTDIPNSRCCALSEEIRFPCSNSWTFVLGTGSFRLGSGSIWLMLCAMVLLLIVLSCSVCCFRTFFSDCVPFFWQVYNKEWSFGYCENGSGVFHCQPKRNPMYTYRESISLGRTELTRMRVEAVVEDLSREWPGDSYDLLSRNCNHFCDAFCVRLGVERAPCKCCTLLPSLNILIACCKTCHWSIIF